MEDKIAKASVLLCTFNGERYIKEQIESILNQSIEIDKIYILDYGSHDKTVEIVRTIASSQKKILLYQFPNTKSVIKSFINALQLVGETILPDDILYICDQDDSWFPNKNGAIQKLGIHKSPKPILVHHDVVVTDERLQEIETEFYTYEQREILCSKKPHREFISTVIGHTICLNYAAVKLLFKKQFDERIIMHDWFWGAIVERMGEVIFLDEKLSFYRQHEHNLIGLNKSKKINQKIINVLQNIILKCAQIEYLNELSIVDKIRIQELKTYLINQKFYKELLILNLTLVLCSVSLKKIKFE